MPKLVLGFVAVSTTAIVGSTLSAKPQLAEVARHGAVKVLNSPDSIIMTARNDEEVERIKEEALKSLVSAEAQMADAAEHASAAPATAPSSDRVLVIGLSGDVREASGEERATARRDLIDAASDLRSAIRDTAS